MNGIRTNAAAVMLGVSPNTLRSWERRYGFPRPHRSPRRSSPVRTDRDRVAAAGARRDAQRLLGDLARPRARRGPVVLRPPGRPRSPSSTRTRRTACSRRASPSARSSARSRRSCSTRSARRGSATSARRAEYEFAWRFATGWLSALKRVAPPATRPEGVLILDASAPARPRRAARPGARAASLRRADCARCR